MSSSGYEFLIKNSKKFQKLKEECISATKTSLTGITNLIVNYEDYYLIEHFLKNCFKYQELYRETFDIDAVELQHGKPGTGNAITSIDELIYGTLKIKKEKDDLGMDVYVIDPQTGKRERNSDGFITRKEVIAQTAEDKLLIIKNIDLSLDFCPQKNGVIDSRSVWIFDNFRNPNVKKSCRLLLISNEQIKLPFPIRVVKIEPVDEFEAEEIINSWKNRYEDNQYICNFSDNYKKQIIRKISGLRYTDAADSLGEAMIKSRDSSKKTVDISNVVKLLRERINKNHIEDAFGLTHLTSKPWEDYICPESSSFTYDVKKILRDFEEINKLETEFKNKNNPNVLQNINSIRMRMPHVIVLYGKGGIGKSAFPVHFAGLLGFDVWDFNIAASHSKWIGEGPQRMREALSKIAKTSHMVIRIDEYDRAMGATSSSGDGMHEAHKQVESEFMNWLQNSQEENVFVKNDIFIVMTTNHKDNITGPLLRSGRADLVIDIADFDSKSIKEAFVSSPRRMKNRGVSVLGFDTYEKLEEEIKKLDLDKLSEIACRNGFTIRDIDILIQEMAAHNYYSKIGKLGLLWNDCNFEEVLLNSSGSSKSKNTSELILGDRIVLENKKEDIKDNKMQQTHFDFFSECFSGFDLDKFVNKCFIK